MIETVVNEAMKPERDQALATTLDIRLTIHSDL
jgi:hypothetical protein